MTTEHERRWMKAQTDSLPKRFPLVSLVALLLSTVLLLPARAAEITFTGTLTAPIKLFREPRSAAPLEGTVPAGARITFQLDESGWLLVVAKTDTSAFIGYAKARSLRASVTDLHSVVKSNAESHDSIVTSDVVLHSNVDSFNCEKDYDGRGYRDCVVGVDVSVKVPVEGYVSISVSCDAEVAFAHGDDDYYPSSSNGSESTHITTSAGFGSSHIDVTVDRPYAFTEPFYIAKLRNGHCLVDSID